MDGVTHIYTLLSAPWCAWTMLCLLLFAFLAELFQPGIVTQSLSVVFTRGDRVYKDAPANFPGLLFISLFRLGVLSMALCLCFCTLNHAPFAAFWVVAGLIIVVALVKMGINALLDYTFLLSRRFGAAHEAYSSLITVSTVVLYPVLLVLLHCDNTTAAVWTLALMAALFIGVWAYRCVRTYLVSPAALIYLLLYIATMEVLPLLALFYLSDKMIAFL